MANLLRAVVVHYHEMWPVYMGLSLGAYWAGAVDDTATGRGLDYRRGCAFATVGFFAPIAVPTIGIHYLIRRHFFSDNKMNKQTYIVSNEADRSKIASVLVTTLGLEVGPRATADKFAIEMRGDQVTVTGPLPLPSQSQLDTALKDAPVPPPPVHDFVHIARSIATLAKSIPAVAQEDPTKITTLKQAVEYMKKVYS